MAKKKAKAKGTVVTTLVHSDKEYILELEHIAWKALGSPEGTYTTSNVERLAQAYARAQREIAHYKALLRSFSDL